MPTKSDYRCIFHSLYKDVKIIVAETGGNETIANAKSVFTVFIDPCFKKWKTDQTSDATKAKGVYVYEMCENARFSEMFSSLGTDYRMFVMTQGQIIQFCVDHSDKLCTDGHETFFLFKVNTENGPEYFVAAVCVGAGLAVYAYRFDGDSFWRCGYHPPRLVVPQL